MVETKGKLKRLQYKVIKESVKNGLTINLMQTERGVVSKRKITG